MFPQLPDELNEQILSFVDADDKRTYAGICRANRRGHRFTINALYRTVGIPLEMNSPQECSHRLRLLCRTMVESPVLASYVTEIRQCLEYPDGTEEVPTASVPFSLRSCMEALRSAKTPPPISDLILKQLESSLSQAAPFLDDVYLVLMLTLCKNARHLCIEGNPGLVAHTPLRRYLEHPAACELQSVELKCMGASPWPTIDDVELFMRISTLRRMVTKRFSAGVQANLSRPHQNWESHIEELEIHSCGGSAVTLANILRRCAGLKSLVIVWDTREANFWRRDWRYLGAALRTLSKLEHLRLDHPYDPFMTVDYRATNRLIPGSFQGQDLPPLGSLRMLENLQTLVVSSIALFGMQGFNPLNWSIGGEAEEESSTLHALLPGSLRELTVLYEDIHIAGNVRLLTRDPFGDQLEDLTVFNCQKDRWMSKKHGEGSKPVEHYPPIFLPLELRGRDWLR